MIFLVTPHIVTGPLLIITGVTASALGNHTHNHVSCVRGTPRMKTPNMNVQAEQNAAASTSAPSTTASTAAAQAPQQITSQSTRCGCSDVLSHPLIYHTPKHTLWLFGRAITPPFITPPHLSHPQTHPVGVRTRYHTPCFITPPSGPLRVALYHPGYTR